MVDENKIYKLFAEPVFKFRIKNYEQHNNSLQKYIYNLYEEDKIGVERSNINGWHSKSFDMSDVSSPAHKFFKETREYVVEVFNLQGWKYIAEKVIMTEMWAVINKKNNLNLAHTHPNNFLSAAYYVKAPKNSGNIKFISSNSVKKERYPKLEKATEFNQSGVEIEPEEGNLLIFPSYLLHEVMKNKTDEDRIVISFNIDILR